MPFNKDYVAYVWFDALLNYATAVGLEQPERAVDLLVVGLEGAGVARVEGLRRPCAKHRHRDGVDRGARRRA